MKLIRSLGLRDVVFLNITAIVGLRWISLAAAGGNIAITLWLGALLFFFIPQAFAVIDLTSRYPGEGGIYVWVKETLGEFHGFLAGWCYWTNNLIYFPTLLIYIAGVSVFTAGESYLHLGESRLYMVIFSLCALWMVAAFNLVGLKFGKWLSNIGGLGTWFTGTLLIILGIIGVTRYGLANPMPAASFTEGLLSFDKLTFWASMCFGFSGLELAAVMAGEIRNPRQNIRRGAILAGISIAGIYILGTLVLLFTLPSNEINVISGFVQGLAALTAKLGVGWMSNILAFLITIGGIGGLMAWFTAAARLPFIAGVDAYLPEAFGRLSKKTRAPYVSVLVQTVLATAFVIMSFIGASVEEAYLVLLDTTLLVYFIPYCYMFIVYLMHQHRIPAGQQPGLSKMIHYFCGVSGLLTTLLAIFVSLVPGSEIQNVFVYELKVIGGALIFILCGWLVFIMNKKPIY